MGLIPNPLSDVLEQVLAFHNERQRLISSNIANANTPGYRAFDAVLRNQMAQGVAPRLSNPRHLAMDGGLEGIGADIVRSDSPARLDGNNVSLEDEFIKLMDNRMRYQAIFELMDRWGGLTPIARELR